MLSSAKLKRFCEVRQVSTDELAGRLVRTGLDRRAAAAALRNWQQGRFRPKPRKGDISRLAEALSVEQNELLEFCSSYRYAPLSARKARLVAQLIAGRSVQDALDILKFTPKRAASVINKVLKAAVADADEQNANVDDLYISCARVDDAGVRIGTKRWMPKDRGRAHPISKKSCHIYITVSQIH